MQGMALQLLILYGVFFVAAGACVGSFLNVVIWRLPHRGHQVMYLGKTGRLTLSWPPSHCPMCDAPIQWFQNIPVFSYIFLRGRCANCRAGIPIRYPLVELATAVLFGGMYLAYFHAGWQEHVYRWQHPGWGIAAAGVVTRSDWLVLILHCVFASALLAASAIDADLFIIPLAIPWFLAILGLIASAILGPPVVGHSIAIIPQIDMTAWNGGLGRAILGATFGLLLANLLLLLGILPRSFAMHEPEADHTAPEASKSNNPASADVPSAQSDGKEPLLPPPPRLTKYKAAVLGVEGILAIALLLWFIVSAKTATLFTVCAGILIFLIGVLPRDAGQIDVTDEVVEEISSPHVRREVLKELAFLLFPIVCGIISFYIPFQLPHADWLARILGSLMGFLVGGGVVWLIRVGGSLGFNKEAMGMGDAHLMAGIGAVIGAPLVLIAFFTAPFLGILWAIVLKFLGKPNVLPYGPWLSVASILALFVGYPLINAYLVILGWA